MLEQYNIYEKKISAMYMNPHLQKYEVVVELNS